MRLMKKVIKVIARIVPVSIISIPVIWARKVVAVMDNSCYCSVCSNKRQNYQLASYAALFYGFTLGLNRHLRHNKRYK